MYFYNERNVLNALNRHIYVTFLITVFQMHLIIIFVNVYYEYILHKRIYNFNFVCYLKTRIREICMYNIRILCFLKNASDWLDSPYSVQSHLTLAKNGLRIFPRCAIWVIERGIFSLLIENMPLVDVMWKRKIRQTTIC